MKNERDKDHRTELLYETDGLMTEFDAVVIGCGKDDKGDYVLLDCTAFFPEGGGQQADTGVLRTIDGKTVEVTDVQTVMQEVRHYVKTPVGEGAHITGNIDADLRSARMQNHGAEHIISGLVNGSYGYNNVGFHLTDTEAVFDLDGPLTKEQAEEIEERANRIVFADLPITVVFPSPEEAAKITYRSKLEIYENVRLVTIEGVDTCACCAPHLRSTGQIGMIKIVDLLPHRGGVRITMTAGINAYRDYAGLHESNRKIMELLSSKRSETALFVNDLMDRYMALRLENTSLRRSVSRIITEDAIRHIRENGPDDDKAKTVFTEGLDRTGLRDLVNECTKICNGIVCAFSKNDDKGFDYIFGVKAENADDAGLQQLTKDFNSNCEGRGGGSKLMTQGTSMAAREEIERFLCG